MVCSRCGAQVKSTDTFCPNCGVSLSHMPPVQAAAPGSATPKRRTRAKVPTGLGRVPNRTIGRRILGFIYLGMQAWWHRFLLASGAGKLLWGLLPLMGACVFCSIVAAPFSAEDDPETEARRDVTATVAPVTQTIAATTVVPTVPPTTAPAPTPATDAAALLPTVQSTAQPAVTEPAAPTATPTILETAAPTPEPAGPPRIVAPQAANVRDQPTAEGSR